MPAIVFHLDDSVFRAYSGNESSALVSWLRRCSGPDASKACPIFPTRSSHQEFHGPQCLHYSPFNEWDYLCYNVNYKLEFMVLDGFRFSNWETKEIIDYILMHKWVKLL